MYIKFLFLFLTKRLYINPCQSGGLRNRGRRANQISNDSSHYFSPLWWRRRRYGLLHGGRHRIGGDQLPAAAGGCGCFFRGRPFSCSTHFFCFLGFNLNLILFL
ncbi:hypothetical protein ABFX02_03G095600 [Erythranthe guttata]